MNRPAGIDLKARLLLAENITDVELELRDGR